MALQYLGAVGPSRVMVEALPPHTRAFAYAAYALTKNSDIVRSGCTQVTHTSELGREACAKAHAPLQGHRRHLCRTASRAFWPSVWLPSSQLAHSRQKKNSWSSSPSRSSPCTPASTSKPFRDLPGQAFGPASIPGHLRGADRLTRIGRTFPPEPDRFGAASSRAPGLRTLARLRAAVAGCGCAATGPLAQSESIPC